MGITQKIVDFTIKECQEEYQDTAVQIIRACNMLISEIILEDDKECEILDQYWIEATSMFCEKINDGHKWIFDQCGHWWHQFCSICNKSKYPELSVEIEKEIGNITEEEYLKGRENAKR